MMTDGQFVISVEIFKELNEKYTYEKAVFIIYFQSIFKRFKLTFIQNCLLYIRIDKVEGKWQ